MAQTKREYLIAKGLAKEGRGRLSVAAHEAIKSAINSGVKFGEPEQSNAGIGGETAAPRTDRPKGEYTFENPDGTRFKRLHTNACATCHYSFQWCYCEAGPTQFPYPHKMGQGDVLAQLAGVPKLLITTADVPEKQPQQGTRRGRPRKQTAAKAA